MLSLTYKPNAQGQNICPNPQRISEATLNKGSIVSMVSSTIPNTERTLYSIHVQIYFQRPRMFPNTFD